VPKAPVVLALLMLVGCARAAADPSATGAAPTVPPATLAPTPPMSTLGEVRDAYDRSWAVYAAAVGRVDPSRLGEAFAGPALVLERAEVVRLRAAGAAIRVRVRHHPDVALVDADTAVVTDALEDHMVRVAARTRRPLEADPNDRVTRAFTLRREGGTWKVTESVAL
jgi:hypothetical protein